jgi:type IV pilus assembly protein PilF
VTKAGMALFAALTLAGCALLPQPAPQPVFNTSNEEDATRSRARTHTELAGGYFELGNMAVALDEINLALRADSNYGPAYNVAGLVYAELRNDRAAQENFLRALRINPIDPDANNNYGRFLCDRKRETEALKYFLAALNNPLYQNPERSYVNAGVCSRRRGDVAAAEEYLLRALKIRPTDAQALYQLADIAYARGRYPQSREYLRRLAQNSAPNAEVLWLALRVERKLGDRDAVASYAAQLQRSFPDSKEVSALLGGRDE